MHRYKELNVWKKSVDLAVVLYKMTGKFPSEEKFGITSQMRRCGVSIASNIAEGAGRNTNGEFNHFLSIAAGSANELETQCLISHQLNYLSTEDLNSVESAMNEIKNMIFNLKKSLS